MSDRWDSWKDGVTQARLKTLLHYSPETGLWTRLLARGGQKVGANAGSVNADGYFTIRIDGQLYYAHRLAFLYMTGSWPKNEADHKDTDRTNNRWSNLRDATPAQNRRNARGKNSGSGFKGVHKDGLRWRALIMKDRRSIHLGRFNTPEEAHAAYVAAARELHGEFARGA